MRRRSPRKPTRCTSRRSRRVRRTQRCYGRRATTAGCYLRKIRTLASFSFARSWSCLVSCFFAFVPSSILSNGSVSKLLSSNSAIGCLGATWSLRRPGSVRGRCSKEPAGAADRSALSLRRARQKPLGVSGSRRGEGARGELTPRWADWRSTPAGGKEGRGVSSQAMVRGKPSRCPTTHRLIPGGP
jgi:hypothetical protein